MSRWEGGLLLALCVCAHVHAHARVRVRVWCVLSEGHAICMQTFLGVADIDQTFVLQ